MEPRPTAPAPAPLPPPMSARLAGIALAVLCAALPAAAAPPAGTGAAAAPAARGAYPWHVALAALGRDRDRARETLHAAMDALRRRIGPGRPELLRRLDMEPPLRRGYGVLPRVAPDAPLAAVRLKRTDHSLAAWRRAAPRLIGDAAALGRAVRAPGGETAETLVTRFEGLRDRLRLFEKNIRYHAYWQQAVIDYPVYFAERNALAGLVRQLAELQRAGGDAAAADRLRLRVLDRVARHVPTQGLAIRTAPDGSLVLPVTVLTDIRDAAFLARFREGVEAAYARSAAARARRFAVELTIETVDAARLYPEGAPAIGSGIDVKAHVGRFPAGALVLTTGADSTHAFTGRYVALGPAPLSRRVLAHEFGHLLGFEDAYVRAYEGAPEDADGVVLVEWTGLRDDLMGAPAVGRVSRQMIETLIAAYGAAVRTP